MFSLSFPDKRIFHERYNRFDKIYDLSVCLTDLSPVLREKPERCELSGFICTLLHVERMRFKRDEATSHVKNAMWLVLMTVFRDPGVTECFGFIIICCVDWTIIQQITIDVIYRHMVHELNHLEKWGYTFIITLHKVMSILLKDSRIGRQFLSVLSVESVPL